MERSFREDVHKLRLGEGETFNGEGILAVTKALLQSGVSYVGGYPGAPVSHLVDVLADAKDLLDELGVHLEQCANEGAAAAMLGASINYPMRGAVTWKSVVGTNVASDALSNLSSAGVIGGAMIVVGEDYGEGSSIIQERSHAFSMKSQMWLLDPRPNLPSIVRMVEKGFELSEASNTPVMLQLRIRACHVHGRFSCKDNVAPRVSTLNPLHESLYDFARISLPPSTYAHERHKVEVRMPEAVAYIARNKLNEVFAGRRDDTGIILQGGMYNGVMRALQKLGHADLFGATDIPLYVLNVTYPLVPDEVLAFCEGKRKILVVEEGQPAYIEEALGAMMRRGGVQAELHGKSLLPSAGEYTGEALAGGLEYFLAGTTAHGSVIPTASNPVAVSARTKALEVLGGPVPLRPPGFCVGCPERPVLSAIRIAERDIGKPHVAADVGCHIFATLPPFNMGNTMLGYGLGLASSAAISRTYKGPTISIMGDGGFWHNGLTSGIAGNVFNQGKGILIIMKNGYAAATGGQHIPTSPQSGGTSAVVADMEPVLRAVGVKWVRTVKSYDIARMVRTLGNAVATEEKGLKVIIADGECQLSRQRRIRPIIAARLAAGKREVRARFGVDEDVCTGDHSCIRLSGCPSLTVKDSTDPLRRDPVAHVNNGCVGCGVCGEVAHAAVLCPSFYRADVVQNPTWMDRALARVRRFVIGLMLPAEPVAVSREAR